MTTVYLILSEATLPLLAWRAALRLPTCIVAVDPAVPYTRAFLGAVADGLRARGRALILDVDRPELLPEHGFEPRLDIMRRTAVFSEHEADFREAFEFDRAERRFGSYALAYKSTCNNEIIRLYVLSFTLERIVAGAPGAWRIAGATGMVRRHFKAIFGRDIDRLSGWPDLSPAVNVLLALVAATAAVGAALSRIRIRPPEPEPVFFACDFVDDSRDEMLCEEVSDGDPGKILLVTRSKAFLQRARSAYGSYRACRHTDGWLRPGEGLATAAAALGDAWRLAAGSFFLSPGHFFAFCLLPYRRVVFRAFLQQWRPRAFWARDDYNSDHIVRTQELRRVGTKSFGVQHGIPVVYSGPGELLRYLDFDVYYVFGADQIRLYRDTWPERMAVRPLGSFGLSRAEMKGLSDARPRDVACFVEPMFLEDASLAFVRRLAELLPDRTVFANVKFNRKRGAFGEKFARMFADGPPNLVEHTGRSYDLILRCRYLFGDSTTFVAEGVQFGMRAFAIDNGPEWKDFYYRLFPGLCVGTAEEAAARIRDIEAGGAYSRAGFADLVPLDGRVPWDVIREDLGLPARDPPLANLAFVGEPSEDRSPPMRSASAGS